MKWQVHRKYLPWFVLLLMGYCSTASAYYFLEETTFDLNLKNVCFDDRTGGNKQWREWAQGVEVNFLSGFLLDTIGVDFSSYHALKLDSNSTGRYVGTDQLLAGDTAKSGYSKIGQAALKLRAGVDEFNATLKGGYLTASTEFLASSVLRLTPSSFEGAELNFNISGINLYSVFVDKISMRTGETYDWLVNKNDQRIEYAYVAGGEFDLIGARLIMEHAESKDYVRHEFIGIGYNLDLDAKTGLLVDIRYYEGKKAGKLWTGGFSNAASMYNVNVVWTIKTFEFGLSYALTKTDKPGGVYEALLSANNYKGVDYWTARQISNFNYDGEKVYQGEGSFNFSDMGFPGLFAGLTYTHGSGFNIVTGGGYDVEQELDFVLGYEFFDGRLQGLKIKLENGYLYRCASSGAVNNWGNNNIRFYVDYNLKVF